jgi:hypothetical protein
LGRIHNTVYPVKKFLGIRGGGLYADNQGQNHGVQLFTGFSRRCQYQAAAGKCRTGPARLNYGKCGI